MSLADSVARIAREARQLAARTEAKRKLPQHLVQSMAEAGLYRMLMPAELGGGEVELPAFIDVLAELGAADGATGWTVMTGATTGLLSVYLRPEVARKWFGDPKVVPAGVFAPAAKATPVEGGYRLSGRWSFMSGVDHATLRVGGAVVVEGAEPRKLPSGEVEIRSFFFRPEDSKVLDTWDTSGLCGTGSHDVVVENLFVPEHDTTSVFVDRPWSQSALYKFSLFGLLALGVGAVGLGIARAAVDEARTLALRPPHPGRRSLAETERAQLRFAETEGELRAARYFVNSAVARASSQSEPDLESRAELRLAATHAAKTSAGVVDAMYHLSGGAAIYRRSPLQRYFRDVHTMTQHVMVAEPSLRPVGRVLLGQAVSGAQL